MNAETNHESDPVRKAIQARIDLLQNLLKEYRNRGYQMILAHTALAVAIARFGAERTNPIERAAIALVFLLVTSFLSWWLVVLRRRSDANLEEIMGLYSRLGLDIRNEWRTGTRTWRPVIVFPWAVFASISIWLLTITID